MILLLIDRFQIYHANKYLTYYKYAAIVSLFSENLSCSQITLMRYIIRMVYVILMFDLSPFFHTGYANLW